MPDQNSRMGSWSVQNEGGPGHTTRVLLTAPLKGLLPPDGRTETSRRLLAHQYLSLTGGDVVAAVLSFASLVVLARVVPVRVFGEVVFAQAAATAAFLILDPRLEDALIRFVPLLSQQQDPGAGTRLFELALMFDALIGIVSGALTVALVLLAIVPLGDAGNSTFVMLALLQAAFQAAQGTVASAYAVTDGLVMWGVIRVVLAVASTAAAITALILGGAAWYMSVLAIVAAASTAIVSLMARQRVRRIFGPPTVLPRGTLGPFWRFAGVASLTTSVFVGTEALPLTVVGALAGPALLARFRVGLAPARLTTTAFSAVPSVLFPLLSRDAAQTRLSSIRKKVLTSTALTLPVVVLLSLLAWLTLPFLVPLIYGAKFEASVMLARLLVIAALVRGLTAWSKVLAFALGRPRVRLAVTTLDAVLLVTATWFFTNVGTLKQVSIAHVVIAVLISAVWLKNAMAVGGASGEREQAGHQASLGTPPPNDANPC
jgi:O-antigen/teichoic acid export membrane protein